MKILLDECTPRVLKQRLREFNILTIQDVSWQGIKNGELLRRLPGQFDVLMTTDKNIKYQHDLSAIHFAIVILPSNRVTIVLKLVEPIRTTLLHIQPGQVIELPMPE